MGSLPVIAIAAFGMRALLLYQVHLADGLGFRRPSLAWVCWCVALTCPLGVLVHECGHWAAGAAVGLRCRRFVLGPIEWAAGAGWSVRRWRQAGGVEMAESTRGRRAVCIAGGPMASLTAGLAFVALSQHAGSATWFWGWSLCAQWAFVGLLGVVPIRRGSRRSDGLLLWELLTVGARR